MADHADFWQQQKVIISAGAGGIGASVAAAFLARGARVHVCDILPERVAEMAARHPGIGTGVVDVADAQAVEAYVARAVAEMGGLTILVNNAGIAGPAAAVEEVSPEDWHRTFAVNVNGQFHFARAGVPVLKRAGGGSIVCMSSVAGKFGFPLRSPYSASKWAVIGLMRSLSIELGPHRIRVNAILPGVVEGERIRQVFTARAKAKGISYDEMQAQALASVSLHAMVSHEEIADMILYITSPAGRAITGQSLAICGGTEWIV